jgi:hypothetical protein
MDETRNQKPFRYLSPPCGRGSEFGQRLADVPRAGDVAVADLAGSLNDDGPLLLDGVR